MIDHKIVIDDISSIHIDNTTLIMYNVTKLQIKTSYAKLGLNRLEKMTKVNY